MQDESLYTLVNAYSKAIYAEHKLLTDGEVVYTAFKEPAEELRALIFSKWSPEQVEGAQRLLKAHYKRVGRLKFRVNRMLTTYPEPCFITLTFTNEVLEKTSPQTRREYVQKYLKANCSEYIANKDFGSTTHREHYHAVASCTPAVEWEYGHAKFQPIIVNPEYKTTPKRFEHLPPEEQARALTAEHTARLAKYVAKLTNHAIKETAESSRLIYSRLPSDCPEPRDLTPDEDFIYTVYLAKHDLLPVLDCNAFGRKSPGARPVSGAPGTTPNAEQISIDELSPPQGD